MAGIDNLAAMLNNLSGDGAGQMAVLFSHLSSSGTTAYAQFCNAATPDQSKALAAWLDTATAEQVKQAAGRLNSGKAGGPAAFLAWLDALKTGKPLPESVPTKKWWQFWKTTPAAHAMSPGERCPPPMESPKPEAGAANSAGVRAGDCCEMCLTNYAGKSCWGEECGGNCTSTLPNDRDYEISARYCYSCINSKLLRHQCPKCNSPLIASIL